MASRSGLYGDGPLHGFSRTAILAIEQRTFRVTFPQDLLDGLLDAYYNLYSIEVVVKNLPGTQTPKSKLENHRIYLGAFNRAVEAWKALLEIDWETPRDTCYLYATLTPLSKMWMPARLSSSFMFKLEDSRTRVLDKWCEHVTKKAERLFPESNIV